MSVQSFSLTRRRRVLALLSAASFVVLSLASAPASQAAPSAKPGAVCVKAKATAKYKATAKSASVKLTCTKVKGKLIWVAPAAANSAAGRSGGTIRVGVVSLPTGKGNPYVGIGTPSIYTFAAIFDPLTYVDVNGKTVGRLATSWKMTNPTTWVLTLRNGVTFSDGETFDADAVVAAFNYLTQDPVGSKTVVANEVTAIASVSGSGNTVTFTTKGPDAILPRQLSVVWIPAPNAWKTLGVAGFASAPVGTGPFKVSTWDSTSISLVANTTSWRASKAAAMTVTQIPDPTARIQALQSGQIDLAVQMGPDDIAQLDPKKTNVQIDSFPQVMSLAFNTSKGENSPIYKTDVRLALNYAVNRESIVKNLLMGKGTVANQGTTKLVFGYNRSLPPYPYDVAKAKALLAAAGYPNGFTLSADITVGSFPADADIYQAVQHDLRKIGVTLLLRQIPFSEWLALYSTDTWKGETFGLSWNSNTLDARRALGLFSCSGPGKFFCNPDMTPVLAAVDASLDENVRQGLLFRAAEINYYNPPALYLVGQIDINAAGSNVKGFSSVNRFFTYDKMTVR
jgi:peptide/nickel transport system substrate-binding protein